MSAPIWAWALLCGFMFGAGWWAGYTVQDRGVTLVVRCLGCGKRRATRYAYDANGFGYAMCEDCGLEDELGSPDTSLSGLRRDAK